MTPRGLRSARPPLRPTTPSACGRSNLLFGPRSNKSTSSRRLLRGEHHHLRPKKEGASLRPEAASAAPFGPRSTQRAKQITKMLHSRGKPGIDPAISPLGGRLANQLSFSLLMHVLRQPRSCPFHVHQFKLLILGSHLKSHVWGEFGLNPYLFGSNSSPSGDECGAILPLRN